MSPIFMPTRIAIPVPTPVRSLKGADRASAFSPGIRAVRFLGILYWGDGHDPESADRKPVPGAGREGHRPVGAALGNDDRPSDAGPPALGPARLAGRDRLRGSKHLVQADDPSIPG